MIFKLIFLFSVIPLLELFVLIPLAQQIGVLPTIGLVVLTAIVGAILGKMQGAAALQRIRDDLENMRMPGDAILDGLIILIACTLLVTPGVLTDIFGIAMLIPPLRIPVRALLRRRFTKSLQISHGPIIDMGTFGQHGAYRTATWDDDDENVIDITPEENGKETEVRYEIHHS